MANRQPNIVRWKYANLNHRGWVFVMEVIGALPLKIYWLSQTNRRTDVHRGLLCDSIPRLEVRKYFHVLKDKTHAENEVAQVCRKAVPPNRDRQADASAHQAGPFYD